MSIAQTVFARLLQAECGDLHEAFEASLAWNKLLLVHLNVLLLGYFCRRLRLEGRERYGASAEQRLSVQGRDMTTVDKKAQVQEL